MSETSERNQLDQSELVSDVVAPLKPYSPPKLRRLGSVRDLTLGGSRPMNESVILNMMMM
jgi:hypothetical protein